MAISRPQEKSKANAIRRVLKQGLFCICGMCNKRYGSMAQAETCLGHCVAHYMAQEAVLAKPQKMGTSYRCTYCKRIYSQLIQAKDCAKACKVTIQKRLDAEASAKAGQSIEEKRQVLAAFIDGNSTDAVPRPVPIHSSAPSVDRPKVTKPAPGLASLRSRPAPLARAQESSLSVQESQEDFVRKTAIHPSEGSKFACQGNSYICLECSSKFSKFKEAIACYDMHITIKAMASQPKKNVEGAGKFHRDGAKYVCDKCSKKYFSRDEVISCFDGHGPEDEVWVTGVKETAPPPAEESSKPSLETLRAQRALVKNDELKFTRVGAKYVCKTCSTKFFTKVEVLACFDGHDNAVTASQAQTEESLEAMMVAAVTEEKGLGTKPRRAKDDADKFYRDGSKYVCKNCNTRHLTRMEVILCFDKH